MHTPVSPHTVPHAPQLSRSMFVSVQTPPHTFFGAAHGASGVTSFASTEESVGDDESTGCDPESATTEPSVVCPVSFDAVAHAATPNAIESASARKKKERRNPAGEEFEVRTKPGCGVRSFLAIDHEIPMNFRRSCDAWV